MTDQQRNTQRPQRYELKVRGHLGETMLPASLALAVETRGADTLLTLPDQAALYGVLAQIERSASSCSRFAACGSQPQT